MTTSYLNVSSAAELSADIKAIDRLAGGRRKRHALPHHAESRRDLDGKRRHFRDQPRRH